ncbi:manganese efflux pump [Effusibacillus dendaii]|nr:manganese efflux pump [Effusibacillus dendaii]
MHWLSIVLIGLASNLDNLGIGVSFGMRTTKIPFISNLIIAIISMIATSLSLLLGEYFSGFVSSMVANFVGGILIVMVGVWSIWSDIHKSRAGTASPEEGPIIHIIRKPSDADINQDHVISCKESVTLGLALGLNCMTSGFGAGISGVSPVWATISVGLFSLLTIALGVRMGDRIAHTWFGRYSNLCAGLLLIGIGFYEIAV